MLGTIKYSPTDLITMPPLLEPLTYEEVTEVYRKEQKTKNVTEIRKDFYPALKDLIERLRKESEKETSADKFSAKAELLNNQMKKVSEKALQIFDFRAEKIMLSALRAAGDAKVEVDRLTEEEKVLFDNVLSSVKERRALVLEFERKAKEEVLQRPPQPERLAASSESGILRSQRGEVKSGSDEESAAAQLDEGVPEEIDVGEEDATVRAAPAAARREPQRLVDEYLVLRILEDIPTFAGPDRDYRLSKEDVVTLPVTIARALIGKGKAVELTPMKFF
jgi:DNA replication factor GINS